MGLCLTAYPLISVMSINQPIPFRVIQFRGPRRSIVCFGSMTTKCTLGDEARTYHPPWLDRFIRVKKTYLALDS
jgi:hypothetical protein